MKEILAWPAPLLQKWLLSLLLCFLILKTVRNSFLATVRSLFYYLLPIYLIVVYRFGGKPIRPLP